MNPITPFGVKWELKHSVWFLFILFPYTVFISFLYVGLRSKRWSLIIYSIIYLLAIHGGTIVLLKITLDHHLSGLIVPLMAIAWINGIINGIIIRPTYLRHLYHSMDPKERLSLSTKEQRRQAEKLRLKREQQRPNILTQKEIAKKQAERAVFIAKKEREQHQMKTLTVININEASIDELSQLPSIDRIIAQKILITRKEVHQFRSLNDLVEKTGIQAKTFELALPFIAFTEDEVEQKMNIMMNNEKAESKTHFGRRVDY